MKVEIQLDVQVVAFREKSFYFTQNVILPKLKDECGYK